MSKDYETVEIAGDFRLDIVQIISVDGTHTDVTADVLEIMIFEDTQNFGLQGSIAFKDNFDIQSLMPLVGQEA